MNGHDYPGDDAPPPDIDLSRFDEDFAEASIEDREFDEIPDGKFQVSVDKVELTTAKSSGNALLKWTLRILGPHYAGRLLWRNNVMASRENIRWLKNDLHICGLDLAKLSDLPSHLSYLLDIQLEVTKRTRGDSANIYFNRRLVPDEQGMGAAHDRPGRDDVSF
jgi:Protein of unknown function (DUF669)